MNRNKMKRLTFISILILLLTSCSHTKWSTTDKMLYGSVIVSQITDGLTTQNLLEKGHHINSKWSWKYGTDKPSKQKLWLVKTTELGTCYLIADHLPSSLRKIFLFGTSSLLTYYTMKNRKAGASISIP